MYIPASHTNGHSIKNMISVVVNRVVGMGLYGRHQNSQQHSAEGCSFLLTKAYILLKGVNKVLISGW